MPPAFRQWPKAQNARKNRPIRIDDTVVGTLVSMSPSEYFGLTKRELLEVHSRSAQGREILAFRGVRTIDDAFYKANPDFVMWRGDDLVRVVSVTQALGAGAPAIAGLWTRAGVLEPADVRALARHTPLALAVKNVMDPGMDEQRGMRATFHGRDLAAAWHLFEMFDNGGPLRTARSEDRPEEARIHRWRYLDRKAVRVVEQRLNHTGDFSTSDIVESSSHPWYWLKEYASFPLALAAQAFLMADQWTPDGRHGVTSENLAAMLLPADAALEFWDAAAGLPRYMQEPVASAMEQLEGERLTRPGPELD